MARRRAGRARAAREACVAGFVEAVSTRRSGVGLTGSSQTMFYAEVTDAQRDGPGGGLAEEGELIEVVHLPLDGARSFADDPAVPKTLGVIFGISWFFSHVAPGLRPQ